MTSTDEKQLHHRMTRAEREAYRQGIIDVEVAKAKEHALDWYVTVTCKTSEDHSACGTNNPRADRFTMVCLCECHDGNEEKWKSRKPPQSG